MQETMISTRYRQISTELGTRIREGVYPPGAQLPTEQDLSHRFRVNRHTVREALKELKNHGMIYSVRGKGNFVAASKIVYRLSSKVRFTQNILELNCTPGSELLAIDQVPADAKLSERLQLATGSSVLRLEILRTVNQLPFILATSYLPAVRFRGLEPRLTGSFSLYALLNQHYGVDPQRQESLIEVVLPNTREQRLLQTAERQPLLLIRSLAVDQQQRPVEYVVTRTRGDLGCLAIDFNARLSEPEANHA